MTETFFALVSTYGLLVIAASAYLSCLAVPIPTFAVMLVGGALAAAGDLVLWQVQATALLAAIAGDQTGYRIGRIGGAPVIAALRRRQENLVTRAEDAVDRNGGLAVFFSTWLVAPLGPYVNFAAGAVKLNAMRFTAWDALGEAIWVGGYTTLGYLFAARIDLLAQIVGDWGGLISAAAVALLAGVVLLRKRPSRPVSETKEASEKSGVDQVAQVADQPGVATERGHALRPGVE